jgi:hypothetical protein
MRRNGGPDTISSWAFAPIKRDYGLAARAANEFITGHCNLNSRRRDDNLAALKRLARNIFAFADLRTTVVAASGKSVISWLGIASAA